METGPLDSWQQRVNAAVSSLPPFIESGTLAHEMVPPTDEVGLPITVNLV